MINKEILANDNRIVRCKDCRFYAHSIYAETGCICGLHSEGETYVTIEPDDFCSYGEKKPEPKPIIDHGTYERAQEKIRGRKGPDFVNKPLGYSTYMQCKQDEVIALKGTENTCLPPLGYKWQDGKLVISDADALLIKRAFGEVTTKGQISMETGRAIAKARRAQIEAWEKAHQKTK